MTPDLAALRASLTPGQRASLADLAAALADTGGPAWGRELRYADHEARILAAMRSEMTPERYRDAALIVLALEAPAAPVVTILEAM